MARSPRELLNREALLHFRYMPRIVARVRNWPPFLANYTRLRDEPAVYRLRRGNTQVRTTGGVDASTIAVVFIKEDYGDVDPGSVVIDIGANIGVFSLYAASVPDVLVFAYEPVAATYKKLTENVRANDMDDRIRTFNLGVTGARERRMISVDPDQSPFSTLYGSSETTEEIECVSLHDVFADNGLDHCDVLKLDCEGAEYEILYNAPSELLERVDRIALEYHNQPQCPEHDGVALLSFLQDRGFRPHSPIDGSKPWGNATLHRHRAGTTGEAPEEPRNLATKQFWSETYLPAYSIPSRPSNDVPFDRCLSRALERDAPARRGERLLELGCAPGRWMVLYAERFGASVEGIEYTEFGASQTEANLSACGVEGVVHQGDFWKFEPEEPYDLVLSLGFIEHFDDVGAAFARHLDLVRPGGRLVLEVPNFQGISRVLQRWCDPDWLALHNMDAMGHRRYLKLAQQHGLEPLAVRYFGGFDSAHMSVRKHGKYPLGAISRFRQWGLFPDGVNSRWWSIGLLLVLRRPADNRA